MNASKPTPSGMPLDPGAGSVSRDGLWVRGSIGGRLVVRSFVPGGSPGRAIKIAERICNMVGVDPAFVRYEITPMSADEAIAAFAESM